MTDEKTGGFDSDAIKRLLEINAEQRATLVHLHALAQAFAQGIDVSKPLHWIMADAPRMLHAKYTDHRVGHDWRIWWLDNGRPRRVAVAVRITDDQAGSSREVTLDPPIILDDPTTLRKAHWKM